MIMFCFGYWPLILGCGSAVSVQSKGNFNDYQCFALTLFPYPGQLKPKFKIWQPLAVLCTVVDSLKLIWVTFMKNSKKKNFKKKIFKIIFFFSGFGGPEYSCHNQRKKEPGSSLLLVLVKVKDSTHWQCHWETSRVDKCWRPTGMLKLKVAFFRKCNSFFKSSNLKKREYSKQLSWTWNLKPIAANNKFKFQTQDSNLEYFWGGDLEIWKTNRTFRIKATFRPND